MAPAYYAERIPDKRDDQHVLEEPERALQLMRLWEAEKPYASVRVYAERRDALGARPGDPELAREWFDAVSDVYLETAPWIDLVSTEFWRDVIETANSEIMSPEARRATLIFDAALRRDGVDLQRLVDEELASDGLLAPRVVAIAGAIAVVLNDGSVEQRRAFAERVMRPAMTEPPVTSEDRAFAMLVAWMTE
jgi:spermidine synthase